MCFAFDASPPDLPAGLALAPMAGAAGAERLRLISTDEETSFDVALAESPGSDRSGVLILPDVRGL